MQHRFEHIITQAQRNAFPPRPKYDPKLLQLLSAALSGKKRIIILGSPQSGKTTLLHTLVREHTSPSLFIDAAAHAAVLGGLGNKTTVIDHTYDAEPSRISRDLPFDVASMHEVLVCAHRQRLASGEPTICTRERADLIRAYWERGAGGALTAPIGGTFGEALNAFEDCFSELLGLADLIVHVERRSVHDNDRISRTLAADAFEIRTYIVYDAHTQTASV